MTAWQRSLRPLTALTVGHLTHDRYGDALRPGGSAFYGARTLESLGARSRLVTVVGNDYAHDEEISCLEVARGTGVRTTTFHNEYRAGEPRLQWIEAVAPAVTPDLLPTDWRRADLLFVAPVCGETDLEAWLGAVDAPLVGLGLQGLLRQPESGPETSRRRVVALAPSFGDDTWRRVHAVFMSDEDLELGGDALLATLRALVSVVVVTSGEAGCRIFARDREERVGVFRTRAIDPTGAGDTFAAAFLFALAQGATPTEAGRLAAAAASIVVEAEGGAALSWVGESYERAERQTGWTSAQS